MRINVYGEEITEETELVTKTVTDEEFGTRTFYGVRVFLHSPDVLHHTPEDDDRTAVTFWVPWTREDGYDFNKVYGMFDGLLNRVDDAIIQENNKNNG